MKTYKIACIPGDGIGKEVIPAGELVLQALANKSKSFQFECLMMMTNIELKQITFSNISALKTF